MKKKKKKKSIIFYRERTATQRHHRLAVAHARTHTHTHTLTDCCVCTILLQRFFCATFLEEYTPAKKLESFLGMRTETRAIKPWDVKKKKEKKEYLKEITQVPPRAFLLPGCSTNLRGLKSSVSRNLEEMRLKNIVRCVSFLFPKILILFFSFLFFFRINYERSY